MAGSDVKALREFKPDSLDSAAGQWTRYKKGFEIYLGAKGLDGAAAKRKVDLLLHSMGEDAQRTYETFEWADAVEVNVEAGIVAKPAEDKHNIEHVYGKFDRQYGGKKYRNLRRQEFLKCAQGDPEIYSIMDFVKDLKEKIKDCQYGDIEESMLCDMIINGIKDDHCAMRLYDLDDDEVNLVNVLRICRQSELTRAHLKKRQKEQQQAAPVHFASRGRGMDRRGSRFHCGSYRGRPGRNHQGHQGRSQSYGACAPPYCERCCHRHPHGQCPAFDKYCGNCGLQGHFWKSSLCTTRKSQSNRGSNHSYESSSGRSRSGRGRYGRGRTVHAVDYHQEPDLYSACASEYVNNEFSEMFDDCFVNDVFHYDIYNASNGSDSNLRNSDDDWCVTVNVFNKALCLEIDSGARCNILSKHSLDDLGVNCTLMPSKVFINGVHGQSVKALGCVKLPCNYNGHVQHLDFQVLDGNKEINLLGRIDSVKMGLIARVNLAVADESCSSIIREYKDVLGESIGCIPGEYEIKIDSSIRPVVHAPRQVPAPIRDQVRAELQHLERCGIIAKVTQPTAWVNSMVCVRKKSGRVRICIDPTDLNKAILREHYPMNSIDDIATRLHGSRYFSTLDANMGYFQIKLTNKSSLLTTFNTPFGRYKYLRMPMGAKCSGEVFQREMIHHFGDIEGVEIVVDDILIHGTTVQQHNERLVKVLDRARKINLKLNSAKCNIAMPEVIYVGHKLTGEGLKVTDERIKAIQGMKDPESFQELETVLGMLAYVAKFIPHLSQLNSPLRELKTRDEWTWEQVHKDTFQHIKETLTSAPVLKYYDVRMPVKISVDASMKGLGAALLQADGVVAYASRALTPTEQRYAQIEKEMLAVLFGCSKFHKLIYGKKDVLIESDHKPLESLMRKPIHASPMRIQRMMLKLQPYDLRLVHVSGKKIGLADCLSRLPLNVTGEKLVDEELMVCKVDTLAYKNHDVIAAATAADESLQALKKVILQGWPSAKAELNPLVAPYWNIREEISTYNGIIFKGERICIPASLRPQMLTAIHKSHLGMVKCKQRARDLIYWPGMNKQIEDMCSSCSACLVHRRRQQKEPLMLHPIAKLPWERVSSDLFEFHGEQYLILVDNFSGFIEVAELQDTRNSTIVK